MARPGGNLGPNTRYVRTAEGSQFYGQPIGSPIRPDVITARNREAAALGIKPPQDSLEDSRGRAVKIPTNIRPKVDVKEATLSGPLKFTVGDKQYSAPAGSRLFKPRNNESMRYVMADDNSVYGFNTGGQAEVPDALQETLASRLTDLDESDARYEELEFDGADQDVASEADPKPGTQVGDEAALSSRLAAGEFGPIVFTTDDGKFVVTKGVNKNFPYPTYQVSSGRSMPASKEALRTKRNAVKFATELAAKDWFDEEGNFRGDGVQEAARWSREWTPTTEPEAETPAPDAETTPAEDDYLTRMYATVREEIAEMEDGPAKTQATALLAQAEDAYPEHIAANAELEKYNKVQSFDEWVRENGGLQGQTIFTKRDEFDAFVVGIRERQAAAQTAAIKPMTQARRLALGLDQPDADGGAPETPEGDSPEAPGSGAPSTPENPAEPAAAPPAVAPAAPGLEELRARRDKTIQDLKTIPDDNAPKSTAAEAPVGTRLLDTDGEMQFEKGEDGWAHASGILAPVPDDRVQPFLDSGELHVEDTNAGEKSYAEMTQAEFIAALDELPEGQKLRLDERQTITKQDDGSWRTGGGFVREQDFEAKSFYFFKDSITPAEEDSQEPDPSTLQVGDGATPGFVRSAAEGSQITYVAESRITVWTKQADGLWLSETSGNTNGERVMIEGLDESALITRIGSDGDAAEALYPGAPNLERDAVQAAYDGLTEHSGFQVFYGIPQGSPLRDRELVGALTTEARQQHPGLSPKQAVLAHMRTYLGIEEPSSSTDTDDSPTITVGAAEPKSTGVQGMNGGVYTSNEVREAIRILEEFQGKAFKSELNKRGNKLGELDPSSLVGIHKDKTVAKRLFIEYLRGTFVQEPSGDTETTPTPDPEPTAPEVRDLSEMVGTSPETVAELESLPTGSRIDFLGTQYSRHADGRWYTMNLPDVTGRSTEDMGVALRGIIVLRVDTPLDEPLDGPPNSSISDFKVGESIVARTPFGVAVWTRIPDQGSLRVWSGPNGLENDEDNMPEILLAYHQQLRDPSANRWFARRDPQAPENAQPQPTFWPRTVDIPNPPAPTTVTATGNTNSREVGDRPTRNWMDSAPRGTAIWKGAEQSFLDGRAHTWVKANDVTWVNEDGTALGSSHFESDRFTSADKILRVGTGIPEPEPEAPEPSNAVAGDTIQSTDLAGLQPGTRIGYVRKKDGRTTFYTKGADGTFTTKAGTEVDITAWARASFVVDFVPGESSTDSEVDTPEPSPAPPEVPPVGGRPDLGAQVTFAADRDQMPEFEKGHTFVVLRTDGTSYKARATGQGTWITDDPTDTGGFSDTLIFVAAQNGRLYGLAEGDTWDAPHILTEDNLPSRLSTGDYINAGPARYVRLEDGSWQSLGTDNIVSAEAMDLGATTGTLGTYRVRSLRGRVLKDGDTAYAETVVEQAKDGWIIRRSQATVGTPPWVVRDGRLYKPGVSGSMSFEEFVVSEDRVLVVEDTSGVPEIPENGTILTEKQVFFLPEGSKVGVNGMSYTKVGPDTYTTLSEDNPAIKYASSLDGRRMVGGVFQGTGSVEEVTEGGRFRYVDQLKAVPVGGVVTEDEFTAIRITPDSWITTTRSSPEWHAANGSLTFTSSKDAWGGSPASANKLANAPEGSVAYDPNNLLSVWTKRSGKWWHDGQENTDFPEGVRLADPALKEGKYTSGPVGLASPLTGTEVYVRNARFTGGRSTMRLRFDGDKWVQTDTGPRQRFAASIGHTSVLAKAYEGDVRIDYLPPFIVPGDTAATAEAREAHYQAMREAKDLAGIARSLAALHPDLVLEGTSLKATKDHSAADRVALAREYAEQVSRMLDIYPQAGLKAIKMTGGHRSHLASVNGSDATKMTLHIKSQASVASGMTGSNFHLPSNRTVSAVQAVVVHEMGHVLDARSTHWGLGRVAQQAQRDFLASLPNDHERELAKVQISGYGRTKSVELVAETFVDWSTAAEVAPITDFIAERMFEHIRKQPGWEDFQPRKVTSDNPYTGYEPHKELRVDSPGDTYVWETRGNGSTFAADTMPKTDNLVIRVDGQNYLYGSGGYLYDISTADMATESGSIPPTRKALRMLEAGERVEVVAVPPKVDLRALQLTKISVHRLRTFPIGTRITTVDGVVLVKRADGRWMTPAGQEILPEQLQEAISATDVYTSRGWRERAAALTVQDVAIDNQGTWADYWDTVKRIRDGREA